MAFYQSIKVSLKDDIRRFKLRPEHRDVSALRSHIDSLFERDLLGVTWRMLWQDEERDLITVATNDDIELLLESTPRDENTILRLFIDVEKKDSVRNVFQELVQDPAVAGLLQSLAAASPFSMPRCKQEQRFRWSFPKGTGMRPGCCREAKDPKVFPDRCPSGVDPNCCRNKEGGEGHDAATDTANDVAKDVSHDTDDRATGEEEETVVQEQESAVRDPPSYNDAPTETAWVRELELLREMGIDFVDEATLITSLDKHRGLMSAVLSEIFRGR